VFPLSCTGARPQSNWNAFSHYELLPGNWSFLIMYITKNFLKCRAVVRSCKNSLLTAVAGPCSCKKKLEATFSVTCAVTSKASFKPDRSFSRASQGLVWTFGCSAHKAAYSSSQCKYGTIENEPTGLKFVGYTSLLTKKEPGIWGRLRLISKLTQECGFQHRSGSYMFVILCRSVPDIWMLITCRVKRNDRNTL
jgi:hypothetical protein